MAAGLGFKTFTTGEVLTAADTNGYLMQGVLVFASAAARDAAITSPQEGQFAYLKDTNVTTYYTGSAWANLDTTGMTNPMTTTGDTIYSSSGSTPARLGIGSTGQVLTVASGIPSWATPASGGGMTLLSTTTLSGTSTNIAVSSGYVNLYVVVYGVTCNIDYTLGFRVNSISSANYYANEQRSYNSTTISNPADVWFAPDMVANSAKAADANNTMVFTINNYSSGSMYKTMNANASNFSPSSVKQQFNTQCALFDTTAMTSLTVTALGPTFNSGTVLIYGVK